MERYYKYHYKLILGGAGGGAAAIPADQPPHGGGDLVYKGAGLLLIETRYQEGYKGVDHKEPVLILYRIRGSNLLTEFAITNNVEEQCYDCASRATIIKSGGYLHVSSEIISDLPNFIHEHGEHKYCGFYLTIDSDKFKVDKANLFLEDSHPNEEVVRVYLSDISFLLLQNPIGNLQNVRCANNNEDGTPKYRIIFGRTKAIIREGLSRGLLYRSYFKSRDAKEREDNVLEII